MFNFNWRKAWIEGKRQSKILDSSSGRILRPLSKGASAPGWMTEGVPYLERGKRDVSTLFKPKEEEK